MIHRTIDGWFDTPEEAINNVVKNQFPAVKQIGERFPVCVTWFMSKNTTYYGMQFWTKKEIEHGESVNTDKTICKLCKA